MTRTGKADCHKKALTDALEKLLEANKRGDFALVSVEDLPAEEQDTGLAVNRLLQNLYNINEDSMIRCNLAHDALGLTRWNIDFLETERPSELLDLNRSVRFSGEENLSESVRNWLANLHPEDRDKAFNALENHLCDTTGETPYDIEYRIMLPEGGFRHVRAFCKTIRDNEGKPIRSLGLLKNVEQQIQLKERLRLAEQRTQIMLDAVPLVITMWDQNYNVIDCSRNAVEVLGFSDKAELIEQLMRYMPEYQPNGMKSLDLLVEKASEAFQTGESRLNWVHLATDGEEIIFEARAFRVEYRGEHALMLCARDIRKETSLLKSIEKQDKEILTQAHWYRSILDSIPLPLSVVDKDMRLTFTNSTANKLFNKNRDELLGCLCSCWGVSICGSEECSIARAKRGEYQTYFVHAGSSYQVNTNMLFTQEGELSGYLEILNDVTEAEKNARRDADAANEAKSFFLAFMSHEMRTPLSAILGRCELMFLEGLLSQEARTSFEEVYGAASTLLSIINDILDLSKIEAGKFDFLQSKYDVKSFISDVISQNILLRKDKPIQFNIEVDESMPASLIGDELRIKQIVTNLLSNAFKYTDEGLVTLSFDHRIEEDTVWVTIQVTDTGIGMEPEEIENLFTDYTRFFQSADRKEGTGLGLSIAKRLSILMGGSIDVESKVGEGSTFIVTFPQKYVDTSTIGHEASEQLKKLHCSTKEKLSRGLELKRVQLPSARVLVVDDSIANLEIARGFMKPYGMHIDCVSSGAAALDILRKKTEEYGVIFMDHMMPDMDGVETTYAIREKMEKPYLKTVPIIAFTANAFLGSKEWFLARGFTDFLSKPISMYELDEVINRHLKSEKAETCQNEKGKNTEVGEDEKGLLSRERKSNGLQKFAETIDDFDWDQGLQRFGGDEDSFCKILRAYIVATLPLLESFSEVDEESLHHYAIAVHGLKSSSRSISAENLGKLAEALEDAAKTGNIDFVSKNNRVFLEAAHVLIKDLEQLLSYFESESAKEKIKKSRPDKTELLALSQACKDYNIEAIDASMRRLEEYEYANDNDLVAWLGSAVEGLRYSQITEKIDQLTLE